MPNKNENTFSTSDFYLAAFLRAKGFNLVDMDRTNTKRAFFIFENRKDKTELVENFLFGNAYVEPKSFIAAIKELKQLLHSNI